jgi:hypothetical protein
VEIPNRSLVAVAEQARLLQLSGKDW